jgi:hypothetical protein
VVEVRGHPFMLGCGWEASLCNLCGGYCGKIAEPF